GYIVAGEDAANARQRAQGCDHRGTVCLEAGGEQLHDEPFVVPIHHERRQAVALPVHEAVRVGSRREPGAVRQGCADPLAPEGFVDRALVVREHAQRDRRGGTPERHPDRGAALVEDQHVPCIGARRLDHVAPVDPRVQPLAPACGASAIHTACGRRLCHCRPVVTGLHRLQRFGMGTCDPDGRSSATSTRRLARRSHRRLCCASAQALEEADDEQWEARSAPLENAVCRGLTPVTAIVSFSARRDTNAATSFLTIRVKWKQAPRVDRPWCGWFWCVVWFSGVELGGPGHWTELVKRSKGARGMPRRGQAKKAVASCDKPWGGARIL